MTNYSHSQFRAGLAKQHGVLALFTAIMFLMISTITVIYLNRSAVSEQHTSMMQYRNTQTFEAAEAGVEWMLGNFQSTTGIDTYLGYASKTVSVLAAKKISLMSSGDFSHVVYLCRPYAASTDTDRCVNSFGGFSLGNITPDAYRANVVRIVSIGVADGCTANIALANPVINCSYKSMIMKDVFPAKGSLPITDALIVTGAVQTHGSQCIQNLSGTGNAIRYGGALSNDVGTHNSDCTGSSSKGVFGPVIQDTSLPTSSSIGVSLTNPANTGTFFKDFIFGQTPAQIYAQSAIQQTGGTLPNTISGGYAWFTGAYTLNGNKTYGSPSSPVALIIDGSLAINGNVTCYCIIYINGTSSMSGNLTIYGGIAVDGTATVSSGNNTIIKDDNVLSAFGKPFRFDQVAGSWKDW